MFIKTTSILWLFRLIHSDLKPENIVLQQAGKTSLKVNIVNIVDFTISVIVFVIIFKKIVILVIISAMRILPCRMQSSTNIIIIIIVLTISVIIFMVFMVFVIIRWY